MRVLLLGLLVASLCTVLPATAGADTQPCGDHPLVEAYACFWGSTGAQHVSVCGTYLGDYCFPI